jgi:hypothetical protein
MKHAHRLSIHQPARYRIQVQGWVDDRWADWLGGLTLVREGEDNTATTTLTGIVADQSALMGLLQLLCNLGFPVLSATQLEEGEHS